MGIIAGHSYFGEPGIRTECIAVKDDSNYPRQDKAIARIASDLCSRNVVNPGDFLIPAPQHTGSAKYTMDIASIIASRTGAYVYDVLKCKPHESIRNLKRRGLKPEIQMYRCGGIPTTGTLFFVDNVIATGTTFNAANKLFNGRLVPLIYAVDESTYKFVTMVPEKVPEKSEYEEKH